MAGVLLFTLFREDQFSGIRLAQQVELAVMLDNHPPFNAEQRFAVNAAIGGGGGRCCVFFTGVAALLSVRDIVFINNNQCNNDNHYQ